ncbi:hypothetical protein AP071_06110 [Rhodobacter capsulatus]|nr:hypothetical protein AP071_06110 [Rhodobacter capsulatus]KQB15823.1 hypothetical protein AP073_12565 [Rhodobacter capsulatus]
MVEPAAKGEVEQRIVERWTPLEVSFVTVPADPRAQVRAADQASYPVEIVDTRMQKEASMPENTTIVAGDVPASTETRQPPVAAPANTEPTGAPDSEAIATRAREAERDRVSTIYDLAGRLNLERSFAEDLVKRGVSVDESRRLILDQVAAKSPTSFPFRQMAVEPLIGPRDQLLVEALLAHARLVPADKQDRLPVGIECDAPYAVSSVTAQFLHVRMLRPGQGVGMRSSECRPLAFQKECAGQNRVLNLRWECVELRFELLGKRNRPRHAIIMSWKLYSRKALILQERPEYSHAHPPRNNPHRAVHAAFGVARHHPAR